MLRMPGKDALPVGPKRELVIELFVHYREAARPPLPRIESLTKTMPDSHPVSRETIRRLLTGTTTSQWPVVDAVLRALCHLQGRDPDGRRWAEADDHWDDDPSTCREYLRQLWNNDIDDLEKSETPTAPPAAPEPPASGWGTTAPTSGWGSQAPAVPATRQAPADDPWATSAPPAQPSPPAAYSDEPPF